MFDTTAYELVRLVQIPRYVKYLWGENIHCWLIQTLHDHICIILLIYVTLHRNYQRLCRKKGQDIKITEEIKRRVCVCSSGFIMRVG